MGAKTGLIYLSKEVCGECAELPQSLGALSNSDGEKHPANLDGQIIGCGKPLSLRSQVAWTIVRAILGAEAEVLRAASEDGQHLRRFAAESGAAFGVTAAKALWRERHAALSASGTATSTPSKGFGGPL